MSIVFFNKNGQVVHTITISEQTDRSKLDAWAKGFAAAQGYDRWEMTMVWDSADYPSDIDSRYQLKAETVKDPTEAEVKAYYSK